MERNLDLDANPTVAMDELTFPKLWRDLKDARVLEIGCGTGRLTSRLVAQGNRVTAIDFSSQMLARRRPEASRMLNGSKEISQMARSIRA